MPTRGEIPVRWRPRGCTDTLSGDNSPPGGMTSLSNLIPDPSTLGCFICRPANTKIVDFSTWGAAPGTIGTASVAYQVDNIIFGLVGITSGTFTGLDYPFAYNDTTSAFVAVTGITTANCPMSQATSGDWTPPQMTLTGVDLVLTHPNFDGTTHFFGWFDLTTPTAPVWNAGNTTTHGLPSIPQACGTFNNRTRFACGNTVYYTDTLALAMTNANQSQTIGDLTNVTTLAPLPVSTTSQAIIQGLLAFKKTATYLITGDPTSNNLGANEISDSVGTAAPRSVVSTPTGVMFMAVDGIRTISFLGLLSNPNPDLAIPFMYAQYPSRVAAGFNSDVYRICVYNTSVTQNNKQDWWYHLSRKIWTGPHTFEYDQVLQISNDFVLLSNDNIGTLWRSFSIQDHNGFGNTYVENGADLSWVFKTCPMLDLDNLYANSVERTTLELAVPSSGQTYTFEINNESDTQLTSATITEGTSQMVWGSSKWGVASWGASTTGLAPVTIPWTDAAISNRFIFQASGPSGVGLRISSLHLGYKRLNYLTN